MGEICGGLQIGGRPKDQPTNPDWRAGAIGLGSCQRWRRCYAVRQWPGAPAEREAAGEPPRCPT